MTSKEEIFLDIKKILVDVFEFTDSALALDTNLYIDLGLDSLDFIDLSVQFGADIGVKFTAEDLRQIRTIADLVEVVYRRLNAGQFLET